MALEKKCVKEEEIKSSIVGTFYDAPIDVFNEEKEPKPEAYVKIGDSVNPETVVCMVETMKVPNEIKAGVYGTIKEKLVSSGQPVEYDQALFKVTLDNKLD
jgi:acetyl-CoA carboxylase biotin carboxyl carrier protein